MGKCDMCNYCKEWKLSACCDAPFMGETEYCSDCGEWSENQCSDCEDYEKTPDEAADDRADTIIKDRKENLI